MSAAPIPGLATSQQVGGVQRFLRRLGAALIVVAVLPGAAPVADLSVSVSGLRSGDGVLRLCLTADPENFPECVNDARAITRTVPAGQASIQYDALPQGGYAVAIIHDENDNGRLDKFAGIPREGFGFSQNPAIHFGPPRFGAARFALTGDAETQQVRMRYIL